MWLYLNNNNCEALETLKDNKKQEEGEEEIKEGGGKLSISLKSFDYLVTPQAVVHLSG